MCLRDFARNLLAKKWENKKVIKGRITDGGNLITFRESQFKRTEDALPHQEDEEQDLGCSGEEATQGMKR